jgi:hypothetical protein
MFSELCSKDLRAISGILGKNEFILGNKPCQDDCGIFGVLAVVLWGLPASPYEKLLKGFILYSFLRIFTLYTYHSTFDISFVISR